MNEYEYLHHPHAQTNRTITLTTLKIQHLVFSWYNYIRSKKKHAKGLFFGIP